MTRPRVRGNQGEGEISDERQASQDEVKIILESTVKSDLGKGNSSYNGGKPG